MLDASHVQKVATEAIARAREFFNVTPEWKISLQLAENDSEAEIFIRLHYHVATIQMDPGKYEKASTVWADAAHEVAHLLVADVSRLYDYAKTLDGVNPDYLAELWKHSIEPVVMRLENLFIKHNPMPRKLGTPS